MACALLLRLRARLLSLGTVDILSWKAIVSGRRVYCSMFKSVPDLYSLETADTPFAAQDI